MLIGFHAYNLSRGSLLISCLNCVTLYSRIQHATEVLPTELSACSYPDCYSLASVHGWMCKYMFEIVHSFLSTWGAASLEKQQQQQQQQNVKIFKQYADMHRF